MSKSQALKLCAFISFFFFASLFVFFDALRGAQDVADPVMSAVQNMKLTAGGPVNVALSPNTGLATFIATSAGRPIPTDARASASAQEKALAFLASYLGAFGLNDTSQVQVTRVQGPDEVGMDHVRLRQVYKGVPVTAGELTVHLRGNNVVAVLAKTLPDLENINTVPDMTPEDASRSAQELLEKRFGVTDATLSTPRLEIFNKGLLEGVRYPTRLAWFIEATKTDLREFIWVDAHTGGILLHFSQLTDALNRKIHDANSTSTLPGTLIRSEGDPPTGDADADLAYDFSGDTYKYYSTKHGRDSFDNAGSTIVSTVHFCPNPSSCPLQNAFWNGTQMVYGDGFSAADDVDAHELTHAVTQFEANLFYYQQSGALNESFSDIFGETVDLTNGAGTDTAAVRWLLGEDVPGFGAIRDMMNPAAFGDPAKVSSPQFKCVGVNKDNGGVHTNSGVPNHAYALMVDGGSFNGFTITGIGLIKAGKVQYRTLTRYLTTGSNFIDNYNALQQSCADLVGTAGITAANCAQVKKALDAVEMSKTPCSQPQEPNLCPAGKVASNLFFDDLESGAGNFVSNTPVGPNLWFLGSFYAAGGVKHLFGVDNNATGDSSVQMNLSVAVPAGARMQFNHSFEFDSAPECSPDNACDGGVIEYSTNGGTTWVNAGTLISAGAKYNGTISSDFTNPLGGRKGFVGNSFGYTASQLDLSSLAGKNVRFRFRIGTDEAVGILGWSIDDIRIYKCKPVLCNGLTATRVGTPGSDIINGTAGNDVIVGLGGNDIINGLDGNDTICGGGGSDTISGGAGNDNLFGQEGKDALNGGTGTDKCDGGTQTDTADASCETKPNVP